MEYFDQSHRLLVVEPFWAKKGTVYMPAGTKGRVLEGQNLYGYITLEFRLGKRRISERSVVTDYLTLSPFFGQFRGILKVD
jgi:hypothetical protein